MKPEASVPQPESPPPAGRGAPSPAPPDFETAPTRRRRWPWVLGVVIAALLAVLALGRGGRAERQAAKTEKGKQPTRPIPVVGAAARTGDLGVYLTGLGTVTAVNTVTVRSRVEGQLIRVGFREGQLVRAGDLLAEIDPRPFQVQLTQAEGQLAKDEAALKNARLDLERYRVLVQQDSIARQQLDTQIATVNQLEGTVQSDRGQIASAKLNLTYSRVTAPISGTVGLRLVDPGNIVHINDPNGLVVITQLQPITVIFTIPADRLPPVLRQMKSGRRLTVEAYDRELKNRLATGTVLAVDNQIDPATGTVRIKGIFQNESAELYSNQFVNARLLVDTLQGAVIVPAAAIQRSPQSTFVYVVRPDSTVEMRNVEVQLTEGDDTAIRKGIAPGEIVVIDGVDKLQPNTKVVLNMAGGNARRKPAS